MISKFTTFSDIVFIKINNIIACSSYKESKPLLLYTKVLAYLLSLTVEDKDTPIDDLIMRLIFLFFIFLFYCHYFIIS